MITLKLNNQICDLPDEFGVSMDYSIWAIGEIDERSGALSVEVNLPITTRNRAIFEGSEQVPSLTDKPYTKLDARLYDDGIDQRVLFASLVSVTGTYNIRLFGLNAKFFDLIKDRQLVDLDMKDLDHYRNFDNIVSGRSRTTGYLYPVIDNFTDSPNGEIDNTTSQVNPKYLYPAPYFEDVLQRIVEAVGYTLDNRVMLQTNYPADKLCLPLSSVPLERNSDMGRYEVSVSKDTTGSPPAGFPTYQLILFDTVDAGYEYAYFDAAQLSLSTGALRFIDDILCDLNFSCDVTNTTGGALIFYIQVETPQGVIFTDTLNVSAGATVPYTFEILQAENLKSGSVYPFFEVSISANSGVGGSITADNAVLQVSNVEAIQERKRIVYTDEITGFTTLSSMLPDWTQGDLLLEYLRLFCGMIDVNEGTKVVSIFPFIEIPQNINNGVDWSDKLDYTERPQITFDIGYGNRNRLLYKDDETVEKPQGTDGAIISGNENLEAVVDMVETEFAATEQVTRLNGKYIPQIKLVTEPGASETFKAVEQRVLVVRFQDFTLDYDDGADSDTVTTDIPVCYFIDTSETFSSPTNIGFENSLLDYYAELASVLDGLKVVNALFRLTALDIANLDFKKPVYVEEYNAWFYLSKVQGKEIGSNKSTMVELVKLF